jgi:basic membrane lipoprotein Med (substrate-binding protein (PBP1-ABC) superfamily)
MMVELVKQIGAGTWKPSHVRGDLKDGTVTLDPIGPAVPAAVKAAIEQARAEILASKRVVWKGPLAAQDGKVLVAESKPLPMDQVETMSYLVKGVIGSVK